MKQVVLFVTVLMLIKPFWPVAEYIVNYDYIVENLCENRARPALNCDGKCYLSKQLAKESESEDKNPFDGKRLLTDIQFFNDKDLGISNGSLNVSIRSLENNFKPNDTLISRLFSSDIVQPPELG
ncbi:MAG: hypothetical protein R3243_16810 [Arenibacter latericius]|nr:hypothetical protein [Arenibacter latericius]